MSQSVFAEVADIIVWLAGKAPPADTEWQAYTEVALSLAERRKQRGKMLEVLVITDAGSPTSSQRASFLKAVHGFEVRTAVISSSTLVRGVASVFSWFNINNRIFNPKDFGAALDFVGVDASNQAIVWDKIADLRTKVTGSVDTVAMIANYRPRAGAA